jgi:hypothetical protein
MITILFFVVPINAKAMYCVILNLYEELVPKIDENTRWFEL